MVNAERGERGLVAEDAVYTLALTTAGACGVEAVAEIPFAEVCAQVQQGRAEALRALLWGSLQLHHAAAVPTLDAASAVIDAAGGWRTVQPQACDFLRRNANPFPQPARPGDATPDPRIAQSRSGSASTSMRAVWG